MNFKTWLESDLWQSIQHAQGDDKIDPNKLYELQSPSNKNIMAHQRIEDAKYLENLKNSIATSGIKTPISVKKDMNIYDGLHRLICAIDLKLPEVPIRYLQK